MAFFECEFPRAIAFGSTGGDRFSTTVNRGFSGGVQTNRNWAKSLAYFTIDLTAKTQDYFDLVHRFFVNVGGKADGFRLYWALDHNITNQIIGTGDGVTTQFQLVKTYTAGNRTYTRTIVKPITFLVNDFEGNPLTDTVHVYLNGREQTHGTGYQTASGFQYTLDEATGIVTFGTAPGVGVVITADADFHIPVHFDTDDMSNAQVLESDVYGGNALINWTQLGMEELRLGAM
jgi:uncharacterized protein (TIGR02217 family)